MEHFSGSGDLEAFLSSLGLPVTGVTGVVAGERDCEVRLDMDGFSIWDVVVAGGKESSP